MLEAEFSFLHEKIGVLNERNLDEIREEFKQARQAHKCEEHDHHKEKDTLEVSVNVKPEVAD